MSQRDRNRRPFVGNQDGYRKIYSNPSTSAANAYFNDNAANYYAPVPNGVTSADQYTYYNNQDVTNESSPAIGTSLPMLDEAASNLVINSLLTPLAKEFTPSSSMQNYNSYDHKSENQGGKKKIGYWNNETQYRQENIRSFTGRNNGKQYKQSNENFFNRNHNYSKNTSSNSHRNTFKDFNKSLEQSKVLEDAKKFLINVRPAEINKAKCNEPNEQGDNTFSGSFAFNLDKNTDFKSNSYEDEHRTNEPDPNLSSFNRQNQYFGKSSYSSRNKNSKPSYKRDVNYKYEYRNKNYQSYDKKEKNENKSRYQDFKQETSRGKEDYNRKMPNETFRTKKSEFQNFKKKLDAGSQRERLEELVVRRLLECLVCCETVRHIDQIWSCKQCFHILHLQCIKRWAQSSKLDAGWRCPACQNVYQDIPNVYRCYCNKEINPDLDPSGVPHSCGNTCGRKGRSCVHTCTLICHPGPCPDCTVMVSRSCGCGSTKPIVKCSSTVPTTCQKTCDKLLECEVHKCSKKCHEGKCEDCIEDLKQECYCGKEGRKIKCSSEFKGGKNYGCEEVCGKWLSCGHHKCEQYCHVGPCNACTMAPNKITTCPCGKSKLTVVRNSCLDPIPCCEKKCNKKLLCGQPSSPHLCERTCHEGPCPPCMGTTVIRCRCGHMDKELPCFQVTTKADDARCEKKCTKKRLCGKHKCNQLCCIEVDHICPLPCNRLLSCGQHRCENQCHRGRCPLCWRTSFEELYCECGSSVLYPPVSCGTRPPPCDQPCSRGRLCNHDVLHNCHTGSCPPCTVLTKRWCHGGHEQRSTVPCYQENFSCGLACGRSMACGKHKCTLPCHAGACRDVCTQPCSELRPICGHPCNQPCHLPPCPDTVCKTMVTITCQCGLRKSSCVCMELVGEYHNIAMSQLATKMEEIQLGHAVDISDIVSSQKKINLKTLECNEECRIVERNRRLAIGLQIRNPDLSSKLTPRYSDFMRGWAKKDSRFCKHVHDKLTELVQLAKQSKQKSRSYSFEIMNRDKRHFVHEYCEHFGCESAAYDPEPNRNVVATALKDKSWLPSYSLLEVVQRENGHRKVPGPQQLEKVCTSKSETAVSLKLPGRIHRPPTPPAEYVDYFDNPPE